MGKLRAHLIVSFRAKVLFPMLVVMFLLLALTVWVVDQRITEQMESEAKRTLANANRTFRNRQEARTKELLARYRIISRQPIYRVVFGRGDAPTIEDSLKALLRDADVDVVMFKPEEEESTPLFKKRDDLIISRTTFESASARSVRAALDRTESVDTIRVGERLYDVVSIPVYSREEVGRSDTPLIGALTLGTEIGRTAVEEFSFETQSQIVLLANGRVTASATSTPEANGKIYADLFGDLFAESKKSEDAFGVRKVVLNGDHYFCSAGRFHSQGADESLGYLLLSSYEQARRASQATRQIIVGVSLLAIVIGSVVVWFLVRRATEPLEELRDSAEAVGQGDFSRRVEVRSQDECGQLAQVFNQMTENLKQSREQLELTVDSLKTTQAQLVQSEKLSGIGEFVAGVAHELNNPLTSVMGFSELLAQSNPDPKHKRHLEMIHKSALRCHKIVQSLLSFARRHKPERKAVCVNGLIEAAVEILNYQLRTSNIEVAMRLDPRLPQAMVDPHQVQQVFLNIINNARQAIEAHNPKGWIRITTGVRGDNVRVTIQDSGPGIPQDSLSKIFDPFFTTKEVGKGTGLGLSLCYGIINEHGGTITPKSRPGEGATFVIELPITHEPMVEIEEKPKTPETDTIDPREGQGKKVLVIDDEESILHMVRDVLSCRGYQVDLASNGEAGLKQLSQTRYDVTLCDWKMPGMSGQEVFERLRHKDRMQSERIVFITGDVVNDKTRRFLEQEKRVCLPKPFTLAEFREAISKVLSGS